MCVYVCVHKCVYKFVKGRKILREKELERDNVC